MNSNLWVLKTVHDDDKASVTIESYGDSLTEYYNYDNNVANSKNIKANDYAIIIDKKRILGFSKIENIDQYEGKKKLLKCPECFATNITVRTTKSPKYRCNKGHEFNTAYEDRQTVQKYSASFFKFIPIGLYPYDLLQLKPYYVNGYNQNMSMQLLSLDALSNFDNIRQLLDESALNNTISASISFVKEEENPYQGKSHDERETIYQAIKARRGQQAFRKNLLDLYNSTCIISGCRVVDILEAVQINPNALENKHHFSNGLLLRADLHTLFDLDLIRINPEQYLIEISDKLIGSEYEQYNGLSLLHYQHLISKDALLAKKTS